MSGSLAFLCLTRDAGSAITGLATDIAILARPGDAVVLVDDGSTNETLTRIGQFGAFHGWGAGVDVTRIACAARGVGDLGIAANLALAHSPPCDRLVILKGGGRLDLAAFTAARDRAEADDLDLVTCGQGLPGADRMILHRRVVEATPALRCSEGRPAYGDLRFVWQSAVRAEKSAFLSDALTLLPPEKGPNMAFSSAACDFLAMFPDAEPWLLAQAAEWTRVWGHNPSAPWRPARKRPAAAPARIGAAPLRIACLGRHSTRQPFAYPALRPLWQDFATLTKTPAEADLLIISHPLDVADLPGFAALAARRPAVLLSEEPFWDTLFSPDPLAADIHLPGAEGPIALHQVNHHRSAIFDHDNLPYYLLTHHRFAARYRARFARNAARSGADWQAAFAHRTWQTLFMAERRQERFHDFTLPMGNIVGLCAWRTRLALACSREVTRLGASWQGGPTRFDMRDWHLDKLVQLDGQARVISALENTHQPNYLTEKLFDAFACGGLPLYMASPLHRVHDLGLPAAAWINLWGVEEAEAAQQIDAMPVPGAETCAAYAQAQSRLAGLFHDTGLWVAERHRLRRALRAEIYALADLGPA
jgi:hypothetical protein